MDCRRLELIRAKNTLENDRSLWLIAEHEMGGDDFLSVLRKTLEAEDNDVFRLDLGSFEGLADNLHSLQTITLNGDITQLCDQLLSVGNSFLILDNVRIVGNESSQRDILSGIKEISNTILDYCPNVRVIIRTPIPFDTSNASQVYLRALDEPECRTYVELHPNGNNVKSENIKTGAVYSYTAGWPGRIDKLIKSLAFNSFDNLVHGSSDQSIDEKASLPEPLIEAIENLQFGDEYNRKTYELLVILTIFKFGESFTTIRRFGGGLKLRSTMIGDLIDLGLAEPAETYELGMKAGEQEKIVVIKPMVQQYVYKLLGEAALVKYYEDAAAIYFGNNWRTGKYQLHSALRLTDQRIHSIVEQNAVLILARLISDAVDSEIAEGKEKRILDRIRILHNYLLKLSNSSKYLYVVRLAGALLPALSSLNEHNLIKDIRFHYARGLRMLGEHEDSIHQSDILLQQKNPAEVIAQIYINQAYSYESINEIELAREIAQKVIDMKIKSSSEFHARGILIGLSDDERKYKKLQRLAAKARQNKYVVSSNNMVIDLIGELNDPLQQMAEYKKLSESARVDGDIYNSMHAAVYWMGIAVEHEIQITKKDFEILVYAYKYACSQRQRHMFKESHAVLWELLEKAGQIEALLQIFRHSSTLQRLTNNAETEKNYLQRLVKLARNLGYEQIAKSCDPYTLRYFAARANSHNLINARQLKHIL